MNRNLQAIAQRAKCEQIDHNVWLVQHHGATFVVMDQGGGWFHIRHKTTGKAYEQYKSNKEEVIDWIESTF
jgi:hypothetical protein